METHVHRKRGVKWTVSEERFRWVTAGNEQEADFVFEGLVDTVDMLAAYREFGIVGILSS